MKDHCHLKILLHGEFLPSHHGRGAPKKRYKDSLKKYLGPCHIDHNQWSTVASDRKTWRHTIHQAAFSFENMHRADLEDKRPRRKNCNNIDPSKNLPPANTATGPAYPALATSATSMPVVNMDSVVTCMPSLEIFISRRQAMIGMFCEEIRKL